MRYVMLVSYCFGLFYLSGCGKNPNNETLMSEEQAFAQLQQLPGDNSETENSSAASSQGLTQLINSMIVNGQIQVPSGSNRMAVTPTAVPNMDLLSKILALIQGGQVTSVWSLVNTLIAGAKNLGTLSADIAYINQILTAALPVISAFAPQYAPVVQAIISILPAVESILKIFFPKAGLAVITSFIA